MRALPAILGSLTVPIVYYIMQESGYSTIVAAFSAIIILFGKSLTAILISNFVMLMETRQCPCYSVAIDPT